MGRGREGGHSENCFKNVRVKQICITQSIIAILHYKQNGIENGS